MSIAFVLLCLASVALLLVPLAFRDLIDVGFGKSNGTTPTINIDTKFGVLFGLAAFWALMVAARYYMVSWIGERVTVDLRSAVYASVLRQSPQFFETLQTGEVLSRLTGDTTLIQTVVGSSASMGWHDYACRDQFFLILNQHWFNDLFDFPNHVNRTFGQKTLT
jgi:ATP-binding cassette subfamily B protein